MNMNLRNLTKVIRAILALRDWGFTWREIREMADGAIRPARLLKTKRAKFILDRIS